MIMNLILDIYSICMPQSVSRFAQLQAALASLLVHVGLIGVLILSVGWKGFWLPLKEAKSGNYSPLKGFTVVLTPSNSQKYVPLSDSVQTAENEQAAQSTEAEALAVKPETPSEVSAEPENGSGLDPQQQISPNNARSDRTQGMERQASGTPDARNANGEQNPLLARYYSAFRSNLEVHWQGPALALKAECRLLISQLEQGQLVDVVFLDCPLPADARQQIVQALDKTIALPYLGYERVIRNSMEITVCFPEIVGC